MNRGMIFGLLLVFAAAWFGVVAYSTRTLGGLGPYFTKNVSGDVYPPPLSGLAAMGQRVYAAQGCVSCHSQDVRSGLTSSDLEKKLGPRRMVARDYVRDQPVFVGLLRIGPDLSNFGLHAPPANDLYRHLYEPRSVVPGSIMPPYRFLFRLRKISGQPAWNAVQGLSAPHALAAGYEVVPSDEAVALVAYLQSLNRTYPLPEAPLPAKP